MNETENTNNSGTESVEDIKSVEKIKEKKEELTPKQIDFLRFYNDPKSSTFSNAKQSAIKAGYSEEYANVLIARMPDWASENISRRKRMLEKAEKRLDTLIDSEDERVSADVSKFVAKTIGKDEGYSDRTEHTGKNGETLTVNVIQYGNNNPV